MTFSIADESVGESPRLPTLLDETLEKLGMPERVGTSRVVVALIGDKVYDARKNFFALRQARHRVADPPQGQRQLPRRRNRQGAHRGCLGPAALCLSRGSHHVEHRCTLANSGAKCCAGRKSSAFDWPQLRGPRISDKCLCRAPPQQKWQGKPHGRVACQGNGPPAKTGCADLSIMITKNVIVAHGLYVCG